VTAGGACFTPYSSERGPSPRWPPWRDCADLGIKHVWMHRSFGAGQRFRRGPQPGREQGIRVIDWGCPLMFEPTADPGHIVKPVRLRPLGGRIWSPPCSIRASFSPRSELQPFQRVLSHLPSNIESQQRKIR